MVQQLNTACLIIIVVVEVVGSVFCLGRLGSRLVVSRRSWRGLMMWSKRLPFIWGGKLLMRVGDICMLIAWILSLGETVTMYGGAAFLSSLTIILLSSRYPLLLPRHEHPSRN